MTDVSLPLACVPSAIAPADRQSHFALLARLMSTDVRERRALPDGYQYRFDHDAWDDVTRWIAHERHCCPFLGITVELSPNGGPLWVRLTGPLGVHAFLDAELPIRLHA